MGCTFSFVFFTKSLSPTFTTFSTLFRPVEKSFVSSPFSKVPFFGKDNKRMIGLRRHSVEIVDHNPKWATLAKEACHRIRQVAIDFIADIQHVGSTAVPDLPAKPILDLVASVISLNTIPKIIRCLEAIGYIYRGDSGDEGGHLFILESSPDVRTVHLHVVEHNKSQWKNYIRFRDLLRHQPEIRSKYAELKLKLKNRYPNNRKSYTNAKHDFIQKVLNPTTQLNKIRF